MNINFLANPDFLQFCPSETKNVKSIYWWVNSTVNLLEYWRIFQYCSLSQVSLLCDCFPSNGNHDDLLIRGIPHVEWVVCMKWWYVAASSVAILVSTPATRTLRRAFANASVASWLVNALGSATHQSMTLSQDIWIAQTATPIDDVVFRIGEDAADTLASVRGFWTGFIWSVWHIGNHSFDEWVTILLSDSDQPLWCRWTLVRIAIWFFSAYLLPVSVSIGEGNIDDNVVFLIGCTAQSERVVSMPRGTRPTFAASKHCCQNLVHVRNICSIAPPKVSRSGCLHPLCTLLLSAISSISS